MQESFIQAQQLIHRAHKILSISHRKPDGDTLGASCALALGLQQREKEVDMACIDEVPERFQFLPNVNKLIHDFNFREYDLIIVSDAGAAYMTKYHEKYPDIFKGDVPVINIDHHASNDYFGTCNVVDATSASATIIIYKFFNFVGIKITPAIATCLLTGIYNDTGSLMHSNTTLEVFEITGKLVEAGGKVQTVAKNLFRTTPVTTLKLWGKVLENARLTPEGVASSILTHKDFETCGADTEAVSGVIDMLNSIPNAKYACLLNEDENGNVKGSFRTQRDDVDVAALAAEFGGGGHKKAAGFTIPGKIEQEVRWKIVPAQQENEKLEIK